jgi:serine/threonine-protein kinase
MAAHAPTMAPSDSPTMADVRGRVSGTSDETALFDSDQTHIAPPPRRHASPKTPSRPSSSSGWLSSSGSIDHGRFAPGTLLDGRYRIIGLLGRGGMGEVHRADDLRLGQQVALKFLPEGLARDAVRLAQFHNEVRTARQVSHPNVCRVYDIGEIEGHPYLSMEYVDGEDLAASLKRIGRFAEDRAVEIARQICAGLAAAHERGVLHRDLKPANIMLDSMGKVRIMDFSLAAVGAVTDIRAGTPAYMAPEQLLGKEVTIKSDIYALGLVLYELFTGRRAFDAKTINELVSQHESGAIPTPTDVVKSIDPVVERAIVRCLDPEPGRRPASAIVVSASLPGGDPLAAALAAGETPSPEMVAAAGGQTSAMPMGRALAWLVAIVVMLFGIGTMGERTSATSRVPVGKPRDVLVDHAQQFLTEFGYTEPYDEAASGYLYDVDFLNWAARNDAGTKHWSILGEGRPPAVQFWRRTSPQPLQPVSLSSIVSTGDPPMTVAGMTLMRLDTQGRLIRFSAVTPQLEDSPAPPAVAHVSWQPLFAAAALDLKSFHEVAPTWTPNSFADERIAWEGKMPTPSADAIHIEAAGYRGRVIFFEVVGPWTRALRQQVFQAPTKQTLTSLIGAIAVIMLLGGSALLAQRNLRAGRGDRRGALALGGFVFTVMMIGWFLLPHLSDFGSDTDRLFEGVSQALFQGGLLFVVYLALEPTVRRASPDMLITWSRVVSGKLRDPRIGRDVLIGLGAAAALAAAETVYWFGPPLLGHPEPLPNLPSIDFVNGGRVLAASLVKQVVWALQNSLLFTLMIGLLTQWTKRKWIAYAGTVLVITILSHRQNDFVSGYFWFDFAFSAAIAACMILIVQRTGLFATTVFFYAHAVASDFIPTFNAASPWASASWAVFALLIALGGAGFWLATRRPPATGALRPAY